MARTLLQASLNTLASGGAAQGTIDSYAGTANDGGFLPSDPINLNNFTATGRDLLLVYNADTEALSASLTNVSVTALTPGTPVLGGTYSLAGQNLLTITAPNAFSSGQQVTFGTITGTASSFLSDQTVTVLNATATQFTAVVGYPTYASAANTGTATSTPSTHYFILHSAPDQNQRSAAVGATCTGEYTLAPGLFAQIWIPSSALFQQTDGTIWIDSDTSLVEYLISH